MIIVAFIYFDTSHYEYFFLEPYTHNGVHYSGGVSGMLKGASLTYYAIMGYDVIATLADDA